MRMIRDGRARPIVPCPVAPCMLLFCSACGPIGMAFDPHFASIREIISSLQQSETSPVELVERVLAQIEELNPSLHLFISINADGARIAAREAEAAIRSRSRPPSLIGVPFACKDVFWTRDLPTTGGSRVLEDWVAGEDAAVLERLTESGAILLGKTNLHEFGYGATGINSRFGTAVNPWNPERIAGGSSTGIGDRGRARSGPVRARHRCRGFGACARRVVWRGGSQAHVRAHKRVRVDPLCLVD